MGGGSGGSTPIAPALSFNASVSSVTSGGSATLTWSSSNANSCSASGSWSGTQPTSGSQSLTNLYATSTYALSCSGSGGSVSQSVTVNIVPPLTPPDTTPPSAPTNLLATATSSSEIDLSWTASTDNVGVIGYEVFRNGTQVGTPTETSYSDTGLAASTQYTYTVKAFDAAGNISTASNSVNVTTQAAASSTPPTVTITAPTGQLAANTTSTTLSVTTNENATCAWATSAGQAFASMTTFATTGGTSHSTTLTGLSNGTSYTDYVKCKDTYGNISANSTASFSVASSGGTPPTRAAYMGINPAAVTYFSSELPFLNLFKEPLGWAGTDAQGNSYGWYSSQSVLNLDANGYPTSMQGAGSAAGVTYTDISTLLNDGLPYPYYPAGQYIILYDGQGTISCGYDATEIVASSSPGREVCNVASPSVVGIQINITSTDPNHTGDYIRNIRVVQAQYKSLLDSGEIFNPTFISIIKPFSLLRFMDWGNTNGATSYNGTNDPTIVNSGNWSDRTTPSSAMWGVPNGVPVETEVALLNEVDADGWFNLPVTATNDYMTQEATLVHNSLNAPQKAYIEFSNEMWNFGFTQIEYAEEQGEALWPNALTTIDPSTGSDYSAYSIGLNWYAMRVAQMCDIWKSVWGADANRVVCVMGSQAAGPSISSEELACTLWSEAPCATNHGISALAIAPYFGYDVPNSWTTQPDGGLGDLFTEISSGGLAPGGYPGGMIAQAVSWIAPQKTIANSYGLQLVGYESGPSLVNQNDAALTTLYEAANRDPRMGTAVATYVQDLQAAGMNFFNYYNDIGGYSRYGSWGSMETLFSTSTPKYNALVNFVNTTPPSSLDTTPPSAPANVTATALTSSAISLSWSASTDNVAVQGYRVFRNGTQIASTNSTSYQDTGLTASTSYSYNVVAYDAAGNQSAKSSSASATTKMICGSESSPFGLDGSALNSIGSIGGAGSTSTQLTTTQPNDVIVALVGHYGGNSVMSDADDLNWTERATISGMDEWYAVANCPLSSDTITMTTRSGGGYTGFNVFAVSGANTNNIFDPNGGLPATSATTSVSISTSNANDFIFSAMTDYNGIASSAGAGWTEIDGSNANGGYFSEYQTVSALQSNLTASFIENYPGGEAMIGDAIEKAQ